MPKKKMLVISDLHSGHLVGMTTPAYNPRYDDPNLNALADYRETLYNWTIKEISKLGPFDLVVHNGDAIDGRGYRSGSTELIEVDEYLQCEIAIDFLLKIRTKEYAFTYGTPYHTGVITDYEDLIAQRLSGKICGTLDIDLNGTIFNFKHKVGGSQIPHGRATAIKREALWNHLWSARGEYPRANVVIRSHVHYHDFTGTFDYLAMTTPALQGYGSKYGTRQVSGTVDFGFVYFEVDSKGEYQWRAKRLAMPVQAPTKY